MNRLLVAHTVLGDAWWAVSLSGEESLSELYNFRLELKSDAPDIDLQALLGEVCAVSLERQNVVIRIFSGHIVHAAALGRDGRHWVYAVNIAPKLWHASRRADFKIWQNQTVQTIADTVLQQNALRYAWRLKNTYKTWEYLVQYDETDLNFLSRLFEHEGIYYWFEHGLEGETLILGDHFSTHEPFPGYAVVPYYPQGRSGEKEDHYYTWQIGCTPEPGHYTHRDYDFKNPSQNLTTECIDPRGHLFDQYEIFHYPGAYTAPRDGQSYAAARLESLQSAQEIIALTGNVRGAIPGRRFALREHPDAGRNRELQIIRVHYAARNNDYEAGEKEQDATYEVNVSALPANRQYRPPQTTPKPRVRGPDTAVVVGPPGSEIFTDPYGRVKVHFHWDRYGRKDGNDSCWIRVSYPWAGSHFGSIHIPRVGQEVIVDFEHGDPDRPLITGRVYNARHMPPWDLPAHQTQSGILSRSSPGGGVQNANALRFEDAKGKEELWLQAERDQNIHVKRNETTTIGADRTQNVGGKHAETVQKDITVASVQGSITQRAGKHISLIATDSITFKVGASEIEMRADGTVKIIGATRVEINPDGGDVPEGDASEA